MRVTVLNLNLCQWGKKGFQLKENKLQNKLKPDINVTHWFLKTFVGIQLLPLLPKLHVLYLLVMHGVKGVVAQFNKLKLIKKYTKK